MHGHILGVPISLKIHQQVWNITNINLENGDTCDDVKPNGVLLLKPPSKVASY